MTDKFDRDWEREGYVSIWLGDFESADDFDDYMEEQYGDDDTAISQFAEDTGLGWYDHDFVESYVNEEAKKEKVFDLIGPFSYSSSYVDAALRETAKLGIKEANTAILIFDCDYKKNEDAEGAMKFIGAFPYKKTASPAIQ